MSIYAGTMSILLTLEPLADTDNSNVHHPEQTQCETTNAFGLQRSAPDNSNVHHQENKKGETTKAFRLQRSGHGVL